MRLLLVIPLLALCLSQPEIVDCGKRPSFVSDKMIAKAANVVNACQTQTDVATVDIEAVRNGKWPESRQLKCYMYCLWEQFGLVDDKRDLSLNGMLTFFHRIPAYRTEVQEAIRTCKGLGKYFDDIEANSTLYDDFQMTLKENIAMNQLPEYLKYFNAEGDNCEYAYTFNKCYAALSPRTYYLF